VERNDKHPGRNVQRLSGHIRTYQNFVAGRQRGMSFSVLSVFQVPQAVEAAFNYILSNQEQEIVQPMHHFPQW